MVQQACCENFPNTMGQTRHRNFNISSCADQLCKFNELKAPVLLLGYFVAAALRIFDGALMFEV
jgi:hypothetical protein